MKSIDSLYETISLLTQSVRIFLVKVCVSPVFQHSCVFLSAYYELPCLVHTTIQRIMLYGHLTTLSFIFVYVPPFKIIQDKSFACVHTIQKMSDL